MRYIQSSAKSTQVPFNDSLACSKHLKYHLTEYETKSGPASRWSPPSCRLGQPCWPPRTSCSSLHLFQFHSVLGEFFFPGQKSMKCSLQHGFPFQPFTSHSSCAVGSLQAPLCSFSLSLVPVLSSHLRLCLLPDQNLAVAPLLPAITPGSSPLPAGAEKLARGRKEGPACQGLQGGGKAPLPPKY